MYRAMSLLRANEMTFLNDLERFQVPDLCSKKQKAELTAIRHIEFRLRSLII